MNKMYNMERGKGKTTRLLYASEFNKTPILCVSKLYADLLKDKAKQLGLNIPEPITVTEFVSKNYRGREDLVKGKIYVDELDAVFNQLIKSLSGLDVEASTMTIPTTEI